MRLKHVELAALLLVITDGAVALGHPLIAYLAFSRVVEVAQLDRATPS